MLRKAFMLAVTILLSFNLNNALAGDAAKGAKVFKKCGTCHTAAAGAKNKTGPNLWGIYGKKAGTVEGYKYSDWLKNSGIEWNDENLSAWVSKKKIKVEKFGKDVKKSKMIFAGLKKESKIADLIAYMKTLK